MQEKTTEELVADFVFQRQPAPVSELARARLGLGRRIDEIVVTLGGSLPVRLVDLIAASRTAYQLGESDLTALDGRYGVLRIGPGGPILEFSGEDGVAREVQFVELALLSATKPDRLFAARKLERELVYETEARRLLVEVAPERPLSDRDVATLVKSLGESVSRTQGRLAASLQSGTATAEDLVPGSLTYYDRFCGPDPGELGPDEYLGSMLSEYRKRVLECDLETGLLAALVGSLRDDLLPAQWLTDVDDDLIWMTLESIRPLSDPFSVLSVLDIALHRKDDERFRALSEELAGVLVEDQLLRPDGTDAYQLIAIIVSFISNRINMLDNALKRPPYWRRMCAWMQTSFAMRLLYSTPLDLVELRTQLEGGLTPAGQIADLVDLRREPMWSACQMSSWHLRREVLGRLLELRKRHGSPESSFPHSENLDALTAAQGDESAPTAWFLPGPLEGHRRPLLSERELPAESESRILQTSADEELLGTMAFLSQQFSFSDSVRDHLRDYLSSQPRELEKHRASTGSAAIAAAAMRDSVIADHVSKSILRSAQDMKTGLEVSWSVRTLLIAGAAFEEEQRWSDWLDEQLFELSRQLPPGEPLEVLSSLLREMGKTVRMELGLGTRARALASAGS